MGFWAWDGKILYIYAVLFYFSLLALSVHFHARPSCARLILLRRARGPGRADTSRRVLRTKQPACIWRSAPVFTSRFYPAPGKLAKHKRSFAPLLYLSRLTGFCGAGRCPLAKTGAQRQRRLPASSTGRGRRRCPLDSLPTRNDQGMSPWTQKRKVAPGVWLKKLFTARQRNLRIAFFGRHPPDAPISYARPVGAPASVPGKLNVKFKASSPYHYLPATHGRKLGSPSGRAGAKRLRGEPPTRAGLRS